jgi:hypothetical protein
MTLNEKKERLIQEEWLNFTAVRNEGGRADCQDDPETFFIMRRSQFVCWSEELVDSWYNDLVNAKNQGRNLLSEKYAWMMKQTAPLEFKKISRFLRFPTEQAEQLIEEVVKTEVRWMEEYNLKYPYMAAGNREIHSYEDSEYSTSFETYLRGELHTYSEKTLLLYANMVKQLNNDGKSLSVLIMDAMVKAYGYKDIDDAEKQQRIRTEQHR